jgi:di- and tripeptidase
MSLLSAVADASGRPVDDLIKVWRQPSFSIANISSSGTANKTIIPRRVTADISIRIVPDQVRILFSAFLAGWDTAGEA